MEDGIGPTRDEPIGGAGHRKIARMHVDRKARLLGLGGRHHVMQRQFRDVRLAETAVAQQALNQFAANHAGRAQNQNVQEATPFFVLLVPGLASFCTSDARLANHHGSGQSRYGKVLIKPSPVYL